MKPGTKPKPTNLKILEGNPGKRPLPVNEIQPDSAIPQCPGWFDYTARGEWNRVTPELSRLGLLTVIDHAALEGYCIAYSMVVRAVKETNKALTVSTYDKAGLPKRVKKPEFTILKDSLNLVRLFCAEFGLTPSARGRMILPGEDKRSEMEKLLDVVEKEINR